MFGYFYLAWDVFLGQGLKNMSMKGSVMTPTMDWREGTAGGCDGESVRRRAYDQAMARFAGRRGIRRAMSEESKRYVASFDGLVIAGGDPE